MEEDGGLEVLEAAESIGRLLDRLDFGVESFSHGIRNAVGEVGQYVVQLLLNVLRDLDYRFAARVRGPAVPMLPVGKRLLSSWQFPELAQALLDRSRAPRLQVHRP